MVIVSQDISNITIRYQKAGKKMVLLDYDGTLVDFTPEPSEAVPSRPLLDVLKILASEPSVKLVIVTGRDKQSIDRMLGRLPVDIIASHGALIREKGAWRTLVSGDVGWKSVISPFMKDMTAKCRGSFIEDKQFSLAWHYRNTGSGSGSYYSRELISFLRRFADSFDLKILDGNKAVEIMKNDIGKGKAVRELLDQEIFDLILSIGDDVTDEEVFALLLSYDNSVTIKVGKGKTYARYNLESVSDVFLFLKKLVT